MFAQHMIPHHQQAVEMSDMLLAKQGIDKRVTDLATQIKAAQAPEIQQMQGWLTAWGNPGMPPMSSGDMGHGGMPGMSGKPAMQGMMSDADMTALRDAQGVEAAKLYLTQMIAHHEGAIVMAQNEIKDGQYPDAVKMSHDIVTTQQQEIDTMRAILGTL
ncbi:lipoprotein [Mycolicibacterium brisbanense]|uniref:Lipoprotein n=2 Tax=Mycolicibacterium brisbanense TaxID=146020 RepID=A0A100VUQ6_9MYCO|nr:lipoprotein [Mycolicibacterium brisbanense]